jgi:hypothetical protein
MIYAPAQFARLTRRRETRNGSSGLDFDYSMARIPVHAPGFAEEIGIYLMAATNS